MFVTGRYLAERPGNPILRQWCRIRGHDDVVVHDVASLLYPASPSILLCLFCKARSPITTPTPGGHL